MGPGGDNQGYSEGIKIQSLDVHPKLLGGRFAMVYFQIRVLGRLGLGFPAFRVWGVGSVADG